MRFPTLDDIAPSPAPPVGSVTWIDRLECIYAVLVMLHIATLALGRAPIAMTAYPLVVVALIIAIARRHVVVSLPLIAATALSLWCIASNLLSPHGAPALALGRLAPLLVAIALTQNLPTRAFDVGLRLLLVLASAAAIYGVIQHLTGANIFDPTGAPLKPAPDSPRYLATGFHTIHNYLGMTASLWVAIAACLGLDAWRRGDRRLLAFAVLSLALVGVVLLVSFGRAGWVAAFVVLALAPLLVRVRRGGLLPIALSLAALVIVVTNESLRARLLTIFSLEANADRAQVLDVNLRLIEAMPWHGHGFGAYEKIAAPIQRALYPERPFWFGAHSDAFQVLIETGWVGLGLFASMWVAFFWTAARRLWGKRRCTESVRWRIGLAFLIGVAFVICGVTQTALKCYEAFSLLAVAIGILGQSNEAPSRFRDQKVGDVV
ncbi:MAG: O-antigen ligase family protein [Deltaproteobacteria bacterium]|nr:O-antigen ligase family protein [Deltaproteobacteria bacterium]